MVGLNKNSLQELCINSIINNFHQYFCAYSSGTKIPSRHFEFLQRGYSDVISAKLSEYQIMRDEYLEFVINKHCRELYLDQFGFCDWNIVQKCLFKIRETVVKITMAIGLQNELLTNLVPQFQNIDTLIMINTNCSDETLKAAGQHCPLLRSLDVSYCVSVTSQGLKNLCSLNANGILTNSVLQNLNVNATSVEDPGIEYCLDRMPSLEVLSYENVPRVLLDIHKSNPGVNSLTKARKYNLTVLDILYPFISNASELLVVCSAMCPRVKSLHVSCLQNQEEIDLCCKFDQLESVKLIGRNTIVPGAQISINTFLEARGKKLRNLDLSTFSLTATVLAQSCPILKTLTLRDAAFENTDESIISSLECLVSFTLEDANFTSEATVRSIASIFSASPNLEVLRLLQCHEFCPEINTAVTQCSSKLKELDVSSSDVDLSLVETILLTSTTLEKFNVQGCEQISSMEYGNILDLLCTTKSNIQVIWADSGSDYTYSDYDEDFFDDYDVYDDSDYDVYDGDLYDYTNDDSLEDY